MVARARDRLTYANVMATLAVFLALGGGLAWALARNSVKSKHIAQGQVKSVDVQDDGLTGVDIAEGQLGIVPTAGLAETARTAQLAESAQSAQNAESAKTAGSAVDAQHAADADTVGGIPASELAGKGRWANGSCSDEGNDGDNCASVTLNLARTARVLVVSSGEWYTEDFDDPDDPFGVPDDTDAVSGSCNVVLDSLGGGFGAYRTMGERRVAVGAISQTGPSHRQGFGATAVTPTIPAGTHTFTTRCQQGDGDLAWAVELSAVVLGSG